MKFNWMWKDQVMTEVDATNPQNIKIINHTDDILRRAFGINLKPTEKDLEELYKSRILPENRGNLFKYLMEMEVFFYHPLSIVEKTKGATFDDEHWIKFQEDNTTYEDIFKWKEGGGTWWI